MAGNVWECVRDTFDDGQADYPDREPRFAWRLVGRSAAQRPVRVPRRLSPRQPCLRRRFSCGENLRPGQPGGFTACRFTSYPLYRCEERAARKIRRKAVVKFNATPTVSSRGMAPGESSSQLPAAFWPPVPRASGGRLVMPKTND